MKRNTWLYGILVFVYFLLYVVLPLVFVMRNQNEIYAEGATSAFFGFGNLIMFMTGIVFVIMIFSAKHVPVFRLFASYLVGLALVYFPFRGGGDLELSFLVYSEILYISILLTGFLFIVQAFYHAFRSDGLGFFKPKKGDKHGSLSLILGMISIGLFGVIGPVFVVSRMVPHMISAQEVLAPTLPLWQAGAILMVTLAQLVFTHFKTMLQVVLDATTGKQISQKNKKASAST